MSTNPAAVALQAVDQAIKAATSAAAPLIAAAAPTWPDGNDKKAVNDKFAGAMLKMKDGSFRVFGQPSACRARGDGLDAVISKLNQPSRLAYNSVAWVDQNVDAFTCPLVGAAGVHLGAAVARVSVVVGADDADPTALLIEADNIQPFEKPMEEALSMLTGSDGAKVQWQAWVPRATVPAPAAAAAPAVPIAPDDLGGAGQPLVLVLLACGVADTNSYSVQAADLATFLGACRLPAQGTLAPAQQTELLAVLSGGATAGRTALVAAVDAAFTALATLDAARLASATEDSLDDFVNLPAGTPADKAAFVAGTLAKRLTANFLPVIAVSDDDDDDAVALAFAAAEEALPPPPPLPGGGQPRHEGLHRHPAGAGSRRLQHAAARAAHRGRPLRRRTRRSPRRRARSLGPRSGHRP